MKTFSFYSFKGGVGRSLSLVNLAYLLTNNYNKKVGIIDLDVESSGIHSILNMKIKNGYDLINFLYPKNRKISEFEKYIYDVPRSIIGNTNLHILPTKCDSAKLAQLEWDESVELFISEEIIRAFGNTYHLDYLLLDGRTGLSKYSVLALKQAEIALLFCRLDKQNLEGMERMVKVCKAANKPFLSVVSGCPMITGYKSRVSTFEKKIKSKIDIILPYMNSLYFDEFIVCQKKPKAKLSLAYSKLASKIISKEKEYDEKIDIL